MRIRGRSLTSKTFEREDLDIEFIIITLLVPYEELVLKGDLKIAENYMHLVIHPNDFGHLFSNDEVLPIKKRRNYYQLIAETTIMEDDHTSNMHEQKECATPQNESLQEHVIIAEMLPEETVIEAKERRRSGKKRKSQYCSLAENHLFE
ncbi:hypothetical protein ACOSQ2_017660 [Xanthoceras sorbifolium]